MAWIDVIAEKDASAELKETYDRVVGERGTLSNILRIHSVNPTTLLAHLTLYVDVMFGKSDLSRAERETMAVVVSSVNGCHY